MSTRLKRSPQERAGGAKQPSGVHPVLLADPGASFPSPIDWGDLIDGEDGIESDDWIETDLYLAALVAASFSSPSPETPSHALDVPGGSSGMERTGDSARQGFKNASVPGDTAPVDAPGRGSSPGFTWSSRLRRRLLARRRKPS